MPHAGHGRRRGEVDEIICWLTGYSCQELQAQLHRGADFATFFAEAPRMNPARAQIKGVVCGVRVEEIEDPLMREIMTARTPVPPTGEHGHPRQADRRSGEGKGDGEDFALTHRAHE